MICEVSICVGIVKLAGLIPNFRFASRFLAPLRTSISPSFVLEPAEKIG